MLCRINNPPHHQIKIKNSLHSSSLQDSLSFYSRATSDSWDFSVSGIARLVPFSEALQQFISGIVLQALFGIIIPKVSAISALKTSDLFGSRLPFPTLSLFRAGAQGPGRFFPTSAAAYAGQREKAAQEQGRGREDCPERLSPALPEEKLPGEGTDSGYVSRGRIGRPRSHPAGPAGVWTITTRPGR